MPSQASKPIAIFQFTPRVKPGYFASYLTAQEHPWVLYRIDQGAEVPTDASHFAGIGLMGGEMSVNDDLPWIQPVLNLIRKAVVQDIPVIGHCLGGQLLAKALGGEVTRHSQKEIGWGHLTVQPSTTAQAWLGDLTEFQTFQWHGDTFSLPTDATLLCSSAYCANQIYALGPHLGMQCHIEMTPPLVRAWASAGEAEIKAELARGGQATQTAEAMQHNLERRCEHLHQIADHLYAHWLKKLGRHFYRTKPVKLF